MTMRWTSYLVLHLPGVSNMPDWMQRSHRADVIMRGYIYPQIEDKLAVNGTVEEAMSSIA